MTHRRPDAPLRSASAHARLGLGVVALTGGLLLAGLATAGGPDHALRVGLLAMLTIAALGITGLLRQDARTLRQLVYGAARAELAATEAGQELAQRAFASAPGSAVPALAPIEVR